jgi:SAM-dependent methyltransferase
VSSTTLTFDNGAAYEDFMGVWSRLVGEQFLAWLAPTQGLRWADIGCGNGCSTEQLLHIARPASVAALDPSAEQLSSARALLSGQPVTLEQGSAMALPFEDASFDAALMALVMFFVPEPAQGLAEMRRVTRPGGLVAAYVWDLPADGLPWNAVWLAQEVIGVPVVQPPSAAISDLEALAALWREGGLVDVEARRIHVERRFADFDAYWQAFWPGAPMRGTIPPERVADLREATRAQLRVEAGRPFTVKGLASAVKGCLPV